MQLRALAAVISRLFNFVATRYAVPKRKRVPLRHRVSESRVVFPFARFPPFSFNAQPLPSPSRRSANTANALRPFRPCALVYALVLSFHPLALLCHLLYTFTRFLDRPSRVRCNFSRFAGRSRRSQTHENQTSEGIPIFRRFRAPVRRVLLLQDRP